MSCSVSQDIIKWNIDNKHLEEFYKHLYEKDEVGGKISLDTNSKKSSGMHTTSKGNQDSVAAPDAILSWHSHPIACYKREGTIYGWPSGEDLRESVISGLIGSGCHIVPSVEGIYVIQVNPCFISTLINLGDEDTDNLVRGTIISIIETYFKYTHLLRTHEYIEKNEKNLKAEDFVDLVNNFFFSDLINGEEGSGSFMSGIIKKDLGNFIENLSEEDDSPIYSIQSDGTMKNGKFGNLSSLVKKNEQILKKIKKVGYESCNGINNSKKEWLTSRVFKMTLYDNKIKTADGSFLLYKNLGFEEKKKFIQDSIKDSIFPGNNKGIEVDLFDMKGTCDHKDIQNFVIKTVGKSVIKNYGISQKSKNKSTRKRRFSNKKINKMNRMNKMNKSKRKRKRKSNKIFKDKSKGKLLIIGSSQCSHCPVADKYARKFQNILGFDYEFKEYPTIKSAIEKAKEKDPSVKSIPAFFYNNIYRE